MDKAIPSRDQVLSSPELLDNILSFVDCKTTVVAQRVSRLWQEVVQIGIAVPYIIGVKSSERREYWALRWNAFGLFTSVRKIDRTEATQLVDSRDQLVIVNARPTPEFMRLTHISTRPYWAERYGARYDFTWDDIVASGLQGDSSQSWRAMQLTQPPTVCIDISTERTLNDSIMYRKIPGHIAATSLVNDAGVTLGQLIDQLEKMEAHRTWSQLGARNIHSHFSA